MSNQRQDLAYWVEVALIALGVLSVVAGIGHIIDWHVDHDPKNIKIAVGFLLVLPVIFLLSRQRFELILSILITIVLLGAVGTILRRSLAGLPIMIPCALLAYFLVKWKLKPLAPETADAKAEDKNV
jgi:hypothetical protein